jgi:hypothetical protein
MMKNINMSCVVFVSLTFSSIASAGFLDSINQAAETVQDTTETVKNINNTVENQPAVAVPAKTEAAAEAVKTESAAVPAKTEAAAEAVETEAAAVPAETEAAAVPAKTSLTDTLMKQLGVTSEQAQGGSGALFEAAKNNMSDSDFGQLSQAVPGMDGMLAAAPKSESDSATGSLLSGIASASGNSKLTDATSLVDAFQQLDLSGDMVGKFTPVIIDYVKKNGSEHLGTLLQSALTGM